MDIFEELKGYKELLDCGIISQEEFDDKKRELLSSKVPHKENSPKETILAIESHEGNYPGDKERTIILPCKKRTIIIVMILLVVAGIGVSVLIKNKSEKAKKSSSSSDAYSYEMDHSTYCLLYMKVSDVRVSHSGNYAYISGTITNNGTSSIRYVKVKASCENSSGKVIDTDWTYAVDSSWLDPGESKSFEMMVKDTNKEIRTASVTVEY